MIVGPDHKVLLPASIFMGAFFLLLIDDVARTITTVEIPLGILTAIIGAPFFLYLLAKSKEGWS
jgi:iron complex transport system permease protein